MKVQLCGVGKFALPLHLGTLVLLGWFDTSRYTVCTSSVWGDIRTARRTASNILVAALLARAPRLVLLIPRPEVVPVRAHAGAGGALDSYLANYSHGARTARARCPMRPLGVVLRVEGWSQG